MCDLRIEQARCHDLSRPRARYTEDVQDGAYGAFCEVSVSVEARTATASFLGKFS